MKPKKKLRRDDKLPLHRHKDVPILTPIQSLPNEILAEIFQVGTSISNSQSYNYIPFPCVISSVDRRWREIAISTPRLWSTIVYYCGGPRFPLFGSANPRSRLHRFTLQIERSFPHLLDITIVAQTSQTSTSEMQSAIDQIIPHIGRWDRLIIQGAPPYSTEHIISSFSGASAPRLRHFDFSARYDYPIGITICDHIFTGGATALTTARIVGPYQLCTPPLVGLTSLHFGGSCRAWGSIQLTHVHLRDLLTASPSLENLALEALEISSPSGASVADVQMPSLRTLSLNFTRCEDSFVQILTLLSMPILETLSLTHMNKHHMLIFESFSETSTSRYTALKTLKLFRCNTFRESYNKPPESFFSAFSSITHLYLISSANFILEPRGPYEAPQGYWPNLNAVTISPDVFPDIIRSRKDRGHPISAVHVPRDSLASNKALWACIREEVEVVEVNVDCDSLQYPGGLDHCAAEEESDRDSDDDDYHDDDYSHSRRHTFFEDNYGVDYDDESVDSELLEYWAVCGSD